MNAKAAAGMNSTINVQFLLQEPDYSYPQVGLCQILFQQNLILAFKTGKIKKSLHLLKNTVK